jgi:hypothetical protein
MAGEWIKFEANTPEKPEVFAITIAMGWEDPDLTVGKLMKVWRWFDQHTIDGNASGVTLALLDRLIGVSGLAQALVNVGWLTANDAGLVLPNFERHNGKTAKDRALTAKRVAKHKAATEGNQPANAKGNGASVSSALPKEEKNRSKRTNEAFASFWAAYPKKKNKGQAEAAFKKVNPDNDLLQTILNAVEGAANGADWLKNDGQFIPYPATWLNAKGWEDEDGAAAAKPWEQ